MSASIMETRHYLELQDSDGVTFKALVSKDDPAFAYPIPDVKVAGPFLPGKDVVDTNDFRRIVFVIHKGNVLEAIPTDNWKDQRSVRRSLCRKYNCPDYGDGSAAWDAYFERFNHAREQYRRDQNSTS